MRYFVANRLRLSPHQVARSPQPAARRGGLPFPPLVGTGLQRVGYTKPLRPLEPHHVVGAFLGDDAC